MSSITPSAKNTERYWQLYEKLPQTLKDVLSSQETAKRMNDICENNNIPDEKVNEVVDLTGQVLLGILPPKELKETLEKSVGNDVVRDINKLIFSQAKDLLENIYKTDLPFINKTEIKKETNQAKQSTNDTYRETF